MIKNKECEKGAYVIYECTEKTWRKDMSQSVSKKSGKKKILWWCIGGVVALAIIVCVLGIRLFRRDLPSVDFEQMPQGGFHTETMQGDMVGAYGVTSIGVIEETLPISDLDNPLEIAEVYISSGDEIEAGKALFRLTKESVAAVREELEEEYQEADLAYRAGVIEYEQSKITAYYEKENTLLTQKQAEEVYEETIANLYDSVEQAKEALTTVRAEIAEYETAISQNTYYEEYQVEYYKSLYDENLQILKDKIAEWGVSWSEVTGGGMGGMGRNMGGEGDNLHSQYVLVLSSLYKILEQNLTDYEQAQKSYEDSVANADFELQTLKLQVSELEQKYAEAKENYDTSILQAKLAKETALSNGEKAENIYEADIEKAEADYLALQNAKEEAENNLVLFEKHVVDDYYYAERAGTLLRVNVRQGTKLESDSRLYSLKNTEEISVTVSVSQNDVAKIDIGDTASVQSSESGVYQGIISAINPVSASDSKTSVTYSVTVVLTNAENLAANETVSVYFGLEDGAKKDEN